MTSSSPDQGATEISGYARFVCFPHYSDCIDIIIKLILELVCHIDTLFRGIHVSTLRASSVMAIYLNVCFLVLRFVSHNSVSV